MLSSQRGLEEQDQTGLDETSFGDASLAVAFAVNFGFIDESALTIVASSQAIAVSYVSSSFSEMKPISCFSQAGKPRVCFAQIKETLVYPVITSSNAATPTKIVTIGLDESIPEYAPQRACSCPNDALDYTCNQGVNIQLASVYSATSNLADTLAMGQKLQGMIEADATNGGDSVKTLVASLGYTSVFAYYLRQIIEIGQPSLQPARQPRQSQSPTPRPVLGGEAYSYSDSSFYNLWLVGKKVPSTGITSYRRISVKLEPTHLQSFQSYQSDFASLGNDMRLRTLPLKLHSQDINLQGLSLQSFAEATNASISDPMNPTNPPIPQIMCQNTIYHPAALAAMAAKPPVRVVQPYLSCHSTTRAAFTTAAGIAAGNAALISSIFLTLALALLIQYANASSRVDKVLPPARKARLERQAHLADRAAMQAQIDALSSSLAALVERTQSQQPPVSTQTPQPMQPQQPQSLYSQQHPPPFHGPYSAAPAPAPPGLQPSRLVYPQPREASLLATPSQRPPSFSASVPASAPASAAAVTGWERLAEGQGHNPLAKQRGSLDATGGR